MKKIVAPRESISKVPVQIVVSLMWFDPKTNRVAVILRADNGKAEFFGGKQNEGDKNWIAAAKREAEEESEGIDLSLIPWETVTVLGSEDTIDQLATETREARQLRIVRLLVPLPENCESLTVRNQNDHTRVAFVDLEKLADYPLDFFLPEVRIRLHELAARLKIRGSLLPVLANTTVILKPIVLTADRKVLFESTPYGLVFPKITNPGEHYDTSYHTFLAPVLRKMSTYPDPDMSLHRQVLTVEPSPLYGVQNHPQDLPQQTCFFVHTLLYAPFVYISAQTLVTDVHADEPIYEAVLLPMIDDKDGFERLLGHVKDTHRDQVGKILLRLQEQAGANIHVFERLPTLLPESHAPPSTVLLKG